MKDNRHNLLVLFNDKFISELEADHLNSILLSINFPEKFCIAHELVDRNCITSDRRKLLKESRRFELRAFRFLINKN